MDFKFDYKYELMKVRKHDKCWVEITDLFLILLFLFFIFLEGGGGWSGGLKLQAQVYNMLPSTFAVFSYRFLKTVS